MFKRFYCQRFKQNECNNSLNKTEFRGQDIQLRYQEASFVAFPGGEVRDRKGHPASGVESGVIFPAANSHPI